MKCVRILAELKEKRGIGMSSKGSKKKNKKIMKKPGLDRDKRRLRNMQYVFLGISVVLILSMVLSAFAR